METKQRNIVVIGFVALLAIIIFWSSTTVNINSGELGVKFDRFRGLQKDKVFGQGFYIKAPWNEIFVYDVRIKEGTTNLEVLSRNGLTIKMEVSYWYKPLNDKIGYLHDEIGPMYHDKVIAPAMRSAAREVIGKYLPEELYSSKREVIEDEIFQRTMASIGNKHVILDDVLIRDVSLPRTLQDAIEKKLKQEQSALEYEFRLQQAELEAQRLEIEAEGKARANKIVEASLTDRILRDKGIEATRKLSESPNAKVVVIGGGKDGLPIILGNQ
ncbi:MAG: prohibitin family protein [Schleiferiaceae bacterium]|nr:prohibitin family protein [Schleiferiaceae bacterium]